MEIDTTTVIIVVILLIVLGMFAFSMIGSSGSSGNTIRSPSYPSQQYSGGGCGRG